MPLLGLISTASERINTTTPVPTSTLNMWPSLYIFSGPSLALFSRWQRVHGYTSLIRPRLHSSLPNWQCSQPPDLSSSFSTKTFFQDHTLSTTTQLRTFCEHFRDYYSSASKDSFVSPSPYSKFSLNFSVSASISYLHKLFLFFLHIERPNISANISPLCSCFPSTILFSK